MAHNVVRCGLLLIAKCNASYQSLRGAGCRLVLTDRVRIRRLQEQIASYFAINGLRKLGGKDTFALLLDISVSSRYWHTRLLLVDLGQG